MNIKTPEEASPAVSPQHGEDSREGQVEDQLFALARGVCSEERPHVSRQHPSRSWVVDAFDHAEALQGIENSEEGPTPIPQSSNSAVRSFVS